MLTILNFDGTVEEAFRTVLVITLIITTIYLVVDLFKAPKIQSGKLFADGRILEKEDIPRYKSGAFLLIAIIPCLLWLYHWMLGGTFLVPHHSCDDHDHLLIFLVLLSTALIGAKKLAVLITLREHTK